jgi:hypothetical protein
MTESNPIEIDDDAIRKRALKIARAWAHAARGCGGPEVILAISFMALHVERHLDDSPQRDDTIEMIRLGMEEWEHQLEASAK